MAPFAGLVAARMASLYRWLLAEPLVHFIVLGALIFVVYDRLAPQGALIAKGPLLTLAGLYGSVSSWCAYLERMCTAAAPSSTPIMPPPFS